MNAHALGMCSMLGAALCFSATSTLIRLAPNIDPFKTTLFRFAIGMALLGTAAMCRRIRLEFASSPLCFSAAASSAAWPCSSSSGPSTPSAWARAHF